eukprot:gene28702-31867_t
MFLKPSTLNGSVRRIQPPSGPNRVRVLRTTTRPVTEVRMAAAASVDCLRVYDSTKMDEAAMKAVMARPRVDFTSILST